MPSPPPDARDTLEQIESRLRSGDVLRRALDRLPAGSTAESARVAYRRSKQEWRRACSFLDASLGIDRRKGGPDGA